MPGLDGLALAAGRSDLPPIVFTTAYDEYAVQAFAPLGFLRVHRAELVNPRHVRALHGNDDATRVELSDGQTAPVSRRFAAELRRRLGIR